MLLSHPNKSLYEHLLNVEKIGAIIFNQKRINYEIEYEKLNEINRLNLKLHDLGKGMKYFQEYMEDIQDKNENIRHENDMIKAHGLISGVLAFIISRKILESDKLAFTIFVVVSKHHDSLDNFNSFFSAFSSRATLELLTKQFKSLDIKEIQKILDKLDVDYDVESLKEEEFLKHVKELSGFKFIRRMKELQSLDNFLLIDFLFSILIFSDKLEAIFHSNNTNLELYMEQLTKRPELKSSLIEEYKNERFKTVTEISKVREKIYKEVVENTKCFDLNNNILSINLPTGTGKTLCALKSALLLKERILEEKKANSPAMRIIYVLPFTSIIEQNYAVFKDVLKSEDNRKIIKHHHLSDREYFYNKTEKYEGDIAEHLVETWESEIIVSTFVQLLHSIFTSKNKQLKKFHNISNSIIILDEVQSIPYRYWGLVKETFKCMSERLNCYFIFMTATMPLIFSEEDGEILEFAKNKKKYFEIFNRITLNIEGSMSLEEFNVRLLNDINEYNDKSFMAVMNTINSSIELYKFLVDNLEDKDCEVFYLSTNIVPLDRLERIERIKKNKKNGIRNIVISTQMIEAGVDIDIDRVYRDFAPMDSIIQTAGRCNREGNDDGNVIVLDLKDKNEKSYNSYVYDFILIDSTKKALANVGEIIAEKDFWKLSKAYYEGLKEHGNNEDGEKILAMIKELNYDAVNKEFALIKQDYKTVDIFVEVSEVAKDIWKKYEKILDIGDRFEKKRRFNEIKKDFSMYVISVPELLAKKNMELSDFDNFTNITFETLESMYEENTGFIRKDKLEYVF